MSKKAIPSKVDNTGILIFITLLFPIGYVIYVNSLFDPTNVPRFLFSSIILLGGIWFLKDGIEKKIPFNAINLLLTAFFVWSVVSVFWSQNFGESIFQTEKHLLIVTTILLFSGLIKTKKELPLFISRGLLCLVPLILLVFLKQLSSVLQLHDLDEYTMYKIPGLSAHKNLQSDFLFFMSVFFIYGYFRDQTAWKKFYLPAFSISLTIILILQTRAVYVAFTAFALTFIFCTLYSKYHTKKIIKFEGWKNILIAAAISIVIAVAFFSSFTKAQKVVEQVNPANYAGSVSANERMVLWYYSAKMFKHHPIEGVGSGNWKIRFPEGGLSELYRGQNENLVFLQPHNDFIWIACELGAVGLLLFLIPLFLIFLKGMKVLSGSDDELKTGMIVFISGIAGWAAISMFDFPKERAELLIISATLFGMIYGLAGNEKDKTVFQVSQKPFKYILSLLLLINIITGFNRLSSDTHVSAMYNYRSNQNHEMVIKEAEQAKNFFVQMNTLTVPFDFYIGEAYAYQGKMDDAIKYFEKSYEIHPFLYSGLNNLAGVYVKTGQYGRALPLYLRAQFIYPKLEDGMLNISYTYSMLKQYDLAEQWANKVTKNTSKKEIFLNKIKEQRTANPR